MTASTALKRKVTRVAEFLVLVRGQIFSVDRADQDLRVTYRHVECGPINRTGLKLIEVG